MMQVAMKIYQAWNHVTLCRINDGVIRRGLNVADARDDAVLNQNIDRA